MSTLLQDPPVVVESDTRQILHLINGEHFAGAERVQDLLAMRLPEFGYSAGFATMKAGQFEARRQAKHAPIYNAQMRSRFDIREVRRLADLVVAEKYDLVHAHTVRTCAIGRMVATMAKVPFVFHVHSPASNDSTRFWMNKVNSWVERWGLAKASKLICVSESLASHMIAQGYDAKRIVVVPNGVAIQGDLPERSTPHGTWTLGTIALFRPRKGTEVLIEALAILRREGHDVQVRAVGPFETEEYGAKLKTLAKQLDVEDLVEWTGFTNDVNAELQQMDAMCLPSLFGEGMPMVVLEAMAAGVPVIGTRVQGVPEVIQDGYGILAEPNSPSDLAHAIRGLIAGKHDWSQIRHQAWQRQRDEFSDRSMAAGAAKVYDELLDA